MFLCACSTSLLKTGGKGVISPGCQIKCMCRNECESCRLKKKSHRFMSQCAPGRMKKNLLDLLKSSIPDISTRKLLRNCVYLRACNSIYMYLIKTRLRISQFLKIDDHFYPLLHYLVFSSVYFFLSKMCLPLGNKASAMHGFKMAMKWPTFVAFDFKRSSNDQDGLTRST